LKEVEEAQALLAQASHMLSSSLDYQTTLKSVAHLAVEHLADWCTIHLIEENEELLNLVVAHKDPAKVNLALEAQKRYPPRPDSPGGVYKVLRTGEPEYFPAISSENLARSAQDEEHLALLKELGLKAALILPLTARNRTLGTLSLIWAESGRTYTRTDLQLAEDLASRAALAIDNARLFSTAQRLNETLESKVEQRTNQMQKLINQLKEEISERKKVEEALRRSEMVLHSLFESSPDATLLVRQDGQIVRCNQQAEVTFDYTKDELVGKPVELLLPKRFHAQHSKHRQDYLLDFRVRPMGHNQELFACRKDGTEFPVDIMLSPVQIGDEGLIIASVRDVTERKTMQAELAELNRRLIDSLETERLHVAQELHDGPMQDLYGISFSLKNIEVSLPPEKPELLEPIQQVNRLAQDVVAQLRTMCSDLRPPSLAPFGLEKAIHAHMEAMAQKHPELDIILELQPDKQLLPDHVRLALFRIFQHAISNVIRHAEASQVQITLAFDEHELLLRIEDNGRGFQMPKRWIELARKGHLGLVGTAERAEAIGGRLGIHSYEGQGTAIQVKVPLNSQENPMTDSGRISPPQAIDGEAREI
jgi:PAS domain S-box-containing protein